MREVTVSIPCAIPVAGTAGACSLAVWSHSFGLKVFLFMAGKEFGIDVNVGVEGQEAGAADVLAVLVRLDAVGAGAVGRYGAEVVFVGQLGNVDGDDPFEAVAGWAAEEELCNEVFVVQEGVVELLPVGDVVEVHAEEAGVLFQGVVGPGGEGAAEGAIVEVGALVKLGTLDVREGAELFRFLAGVVAADVVVSIDQGYVLVWHRIGNGGLEEGDVNEFGIVSRGGLDIPWPVGAVAFLQVKVEVFVDGDEEFLTGFLPVESGEVEAVTGRNGVELVFVASYLVGEFLVRVEFLMPDMEGLGAPGVGVAADAAIPSGDFHYGLAGVKLAEDVGINAGAVMGFGKDGLARDHLSALRWLKSLRARSTSVTILRPFWRTASQMMWSL